ncbi:hypothetical protein Ddye_025459 [Dipteronia dyeriana]|uniref:Rieske domain-containing protein n=1 Tax=Dipteronia dyeriana TaxID=168575 RepID=A0AAD9WNA2_9ROSI|nr:hypothetical protein Ddye_025459 [Dipteronia dyeriana]
MEALRASSVPSLYIPKALQKTHMITRPNLMKFQSSQLIPSWSLSSTKGNTSTRSFKVFTISSPTSSSSTIISTENTDPQPPEADFETEIKDEKFDWFSEWYPIMPLCDLDKRVPHGKKVLGLDIVVWWDKNESSWKVFDDACPHRLAPLSDGRIDKSGRLQCAYHGWCFNGSGDCKLIPQAAPDGPLIQCTKTSLQRRNRLSFSKVWINRDIPYGYEVLVENLLDPAHVPYAHYGIMVIDEPSKVKVDREGGKPLDIAVEQLDINGFFGKYLWDSAKFVAPCTYYNYNDPVAFKGLGGYSVAAGTDDEIKKLSEEPRMVLFFFCIPVSPGNSRLIWGYAKNFKSWIDKITPRWMLHIGPNLVVDSDLYLLHKEEHKIMDAQSLFRAHKIGCLCDRFPKVVEQVFRWSDQLGWKVYKWNSSTITTKRTVDG